MNMVCYPQIWVKYSREYFSLKDQRITLDNASLSKL